MRARGDNQGMSAEPAPEGDGEETRPIPPRACGLIDDHLRVVVDGGLPGSEAHAAIVDDQAFEDAETFTVVEPERAPNGAPRGGRKFVPTSLHFSSPRIRARKQAFLAAMRQSGVIRVSAEAAGISSSTAGCWREWDPQFARDWDQAEQEAIDLIEARGTQLAMEGYTEPVWQAGILVGHVRKFDSRLIQFFLERRRREKYKRVEGVEHSGSVGTINLDLTPEEMTKAVSEQGPVLAGLVQALMAKRLAEK
ncbi:MAG TPA: hypothetical protein VNH18_26450 [Bryobacteraceae bacterium]|nr:hypothetical protein [Bryobacteraceae bacterium]